MWAAFQLNNKEAKREIKVNYNIEIQPFCSEPKLPLDKSLMYHRHLESLRKKLASPVALVRYLVGTGWGAGETTLQTAALHLMHSTADSSPPVWCPRLTPALLTPPSTTPWELRLNGCVLHQRTTFQSSQASNLQSFVAIEPHYL